MKYAPNGLDLERFAKLSRISGIMSAVGALVVFGSLGYSVYVLRDFDERKKVLEQDIHRLEAQRFWLEAENSKSFEKRSYEYSRIVALAASGKDSDHEAILVAAGKELERSKLCARLAGSMYGDILCEGGVEGSHRCGDLTYLDWSRSLENLIEDLKSLTDDAIRNSASYRETFAHYKMAALQEAKKEPKAGYSNLHREIAEKVKSLTMEACRSNR